MAFTIWTLVAVLFVIIGIVTRKHKTAAGFMANIEPPEIPSENVRKYNRELSHIWFTGAVLFEIFGIPLLFMGEKNLSYILTVVICPVFLVIGMVFAYMRVEERYRKK